MIYPKKLFQAPTPPFFNSPLRFFQLFCLEIMINKILL